MCCSFLWLIDPFVLLSVNFRKSRRKTMHEMMFAVPINIFAQIWCKLLYFIIMQKLTSQPATKLNINRLTTQCMNIKFNFVSSQITFRNIQRQFKHPCINSARKRQNDQCAANDRNGWNGMIWLFVRPSRVSHLRNKNLDEDVPEAHQAWAHIFCLGSTKAQV